MIEKALLLACVAAVLIAALTGIGGAVTRTFKSIHLDGAPNCSALAKDTCRG